MKAYMIEYIGQYDTHPRTSTEIIEAATYIEAIGKLSNRYSRIVNIYVIEDIKEEVKHEIPNTRRRNK